MFLKYAVVAASLLALVACGNNAPQRTRIGGAPNVLFATGPIYEACRTSGRKAANRNRCGCVQAVANQSLSDGDQRRGARFFGHPERAQEVRLNDSAAADAFWKRWTDYGKRAGRMCGG